MNVNTENFQSLIRASAKMLASKCAGTSGHGQEWEAGFLEGMEYVAKYIIPAIENEEKQECDEVAESVAFEYEQELSKLRFFGDQNE